MNIALNNLNEKQHNNLTVFLETTFSYKNKHLDALVDESLMTFEIFKECLDITMKTGDVREFAEICNQFPKFLDSLIFEMEEEVNSISIEDYYNKLSVGEKKRLKKSEDDFRQKVLSEFGVYLTDK